MQSFEIVGNHLIIPAINTDLVLKRNGFNIEILNAISCEVIRLIDISELFNSYQEILVEISPNAEFFVVAIESKVVVYNLKVQDNLTKYLEPIYDFNEI